MAAASYTFVKAVGAPAGSIKIVFSFATYTLNDTTLTSITTSNQAAIDALSQNPLVRLSGISGGVYVPPPEIKDVFLADGILSAGDRQAPTTISLQTNTDVDLSGLVTEQELADALLQNGSSTSRVRSVNLGVARQSETIAALPDDVVLLTQATFAQASTLRWTNTFPGLGIILQASWPTTGTLYIPTLPQARGQAISWGPQGTPVNGGVVLVEFRVGADGTSMYYVGVAGTVAVTASPSLSVLATSTAVGTP